MALSHQEVQELTSPGLPPHPSPYLSRHRLIFWIIFGSVGIEGNCLFTCKGQKGVLSEGGRGGGGSVGAAFTIISIKFDTL